MFACRKAAVAMPGSAAGVAAVAVTATVPVLGEADCRQPASVPPAAIAVNGPVAEAATATAVTVGRVEPTPDAGAARFRPMSRSG